MEITFWTDQAVCHYAGHSLDFLCKNLVHQVDKIDNPAKLPEVRPLEDFWCIKSQSLQKYLGSKNLTSA